MNFDIIFINFYFLINFWNFWLLNDLEAYKNSTHYINNESISFEETNSNLENNEYEYLLDIGKIMIALGQKKHFIKKWIQSSKKK